MKKRKRKSDTYSACSAVSVDLKRFVEVLLQFFWMPNVVYCVGTYQMITEWRNELNWEKNSALWCSSIQKDKPLLSSFSFFFKSCQLVDFVWPERVHVAKNAAVCTWGKPEICTKTWTGKSSVHHVHMLSLGGGCQLRNRFTHIWSVLSWLTNVSHGNNRSLRPKKKTKQFMENG